MQDPALVETDVYWMEHALERASIAASRDEVPVGAVIVRDGEMLAEGWNLTEAGQDPTAHAEMVAFRQAASHIGARRLENTTLYVTLEPCAMCAGAAVLARVQRIVFGAYDPKGGACGTLRNIVQDPRLNHGCAVMGGVLQDRCATLLRGFFSRLRGGATRST